MVQLEGVRKTFRTQRGDVAAVDGATFSVQRGQFTAIWGPSGCGKSTLLSLVGGWLCRLPADRATHRPGQLSVGQRQRVAMARALLNRPPLLLADEPTGNLDPHTAAGLLDLLLEFQWEGGTILLVTHDDRAAERAQQVIAMDRGRILDAQPAL